MARDSQVSIPGPLDGVQIPPSKVQATTRSQVRGYPDVSKGRACTPRSGGDPMRPRGLLPVT
jgi:hypothetical protein